MWIFCRTSDIIRIVWMKNMTEMLRVTSTEFGKKIDLYQDTALNQPVVVTRDGRDRTVMISTEEYHRLKRRDRQVFQAGELPEDMLQAVRRSEMDPRHIHPAQGK
jgi:PHD/YefM family antitoxin component YafN of YafNO toxin-antitoxin module